MRCRVNGVCCLPSRRSASCLSTSVVFKIGLLVLLPLRSILRFDVFRWRVCFSVHVVALYFDTLFKVILSNDE